MSSTETVDRRRDSRRRSFFASGVARAACSAAFGLQGAFLRPQPGRGEGLDEAVERAEEVRGVDGPVAADLAEEFRRAERRGVGSGHRGGGPRREGVEAVRGGDEGRRGARGALPVSYTHLRAHETDS